MFREQGTALFLALWPYIQGSATSLENHDSQTTRSRGGRCLRLPREMRSTHLCYFEKCVENVTVAKIIMVYLNEKPWFKVKWTHSLDRGCCIQTKQLSDYNKKGMECRCKKSQEKVGSVWASLKTITEYKRVEEC